MNTAIISCGAVKIWDLQPNIGPQKAQDVYIGSYTKQLKKYVNCYYDDWFILSAKYGIIHKDFIIAEKYDVTFNDKRSNPVNIEQLNESITKSDICSYNQIEVLAGSNYTAMLKRSIIDNSKMVFPLKGIGGMGYHMQWMANRIKEKIATDSEFNLTDFVEQNEGSA